MCCWVRELVFLVVSGLNIDEYSQVVVPRCHFDACARELGAELVEATRADTFYWAVDPPSGDRRMVGGLLGKVRYPYWPVLSVDVFCGGYFTALPKYRRGIVLDFPVALMRRSMEDILGKNGFKYPKEFSQCRIVWFAWFPLNVLLCNSLGRSKLVAFEA